MFRRIGGMVKIPNIRKLATYKFEIHGKVQGVYFRKHTLSLSKRLGIRGWVENTDDGTVRGEMEGNENDLEQMKEWLQNTGSPGSHISKAVFSETMNIPAFFYRDFTIKN